MLKISYIWLKRYFNIIDENIIKLIEESYRYTNIVDFVYEIDKLDSSIEK